MTKTLAARAVPSTDPSDPDAVLWLTKKQAAARISVHERTLDRWADDPQVALTKWAFGDNQQSHVRYKASEVDALLKPVVPEGQ